MEEFSLSNLYRARRGKKWPDQDDEVPSAIYLRRTPKTDMKSGKRLPGDEDGLSIGFKELETMEEFKERTQKGLTICGIVQVGANIVHGLDLTITSLSDDPLHGNIVGMPYDQSTPEMTPEQMAEVNPAKAYNLQTELAKKSKIMARW